MGAFDGGSGGAWCSEFVSGSGDRDRSLQQLKEIYLILAGSEAIVVVKVRSTLRVSDVRDLLNDLRRFMEFSPHYRDYRRLGAVAALSIEEGADRYAYHQGLFVLTMGREGLVTLRNDDQFRPKNFTDV